MSSEDNAGDMVMIERDSEDWRRAWAALVATGRDPANGWMLMYAERAPNVPGGLRFAFKNHDLPFMRNDPAFDGRSKYVKLPAEMTPDVAGVELAGERAEAETYADLAGDIA